MSLNLSNPFAFLSDVELNKIELTKPFKANSNGVISRVTIFRYEREHRIRIVWRFILINYNRFFDKQLLRSRYCLQKYQIIQSQQVRQVLVKNKHVINM